MSNVISFVGNLGKDAEMRDAGSSRVCGFPIANSTGFGDRETTNWFNCQYWGKRGEGVSSYLLKGKKVFVVGELTLRKYTDKDGNERISHDVEVFRLDFVGGKEDADGSAQPSAPSSPETDQDMPF